MASEKIRTVVEGLERHESAVIRNLGINIAAELPKDPHPVDFGWARANYVPGVGSPVRIDGKRPKNETEAKGKIAARQHKVQQGIFALTSYSVKKGALYISNNVPYLRRLNEGHSKQAPAGFIQKKIKQVVSRSRGSVVE